MTQPTPTPTGSNTTSFANFDPNASYGGPGSAASSGATVPAGNAASPAGGVEYWDPTKQTMWVDNTVVPGMTINPNGSPPESMFTPGSGAWARAADEGSDTQGVTFGEAMQAALGYDAQQVLALQEQLIKAGYIHIDSTLSGFTPGAITPGDATYKAYYDLLEQSVRTGTAWTGVLSQRVKSGVGNSEWQRYLEYSGQAPVTKTEVDLTNATQTQGYLTTVADALLGRAPNADEIARAQAALNQAEQANPKTVTSEFNSLGQPIGKTVTTTGGVDPQVFLRNYEIQQNPTGVGNYMAATDYYKAALAALGPGGRGAGSISQANAIQAGEA